jgi:hypothetical protein
LSLPPQDVFQSVYVSAYVVHAALFEELFNELVERLLLLFGFEHVSIARKFFVDFVSHVALREGLAARQYAVSCEEGIDEECKKNDANYFVELEHAHSLAG